MSDNTINSGKLVDLSYFVADNRFWVGDYTLASGIDAADYEFTCATLCKNVLIVEQEGDYDELHEKLVNLARWLNNNANDFWRYRTGIKIHLFEFASYDDYDLARLIFRLQ